MRKQILVALASLMMISSAVPTYAAVIEAGSGKSTEQTTTTSTSTKSQQEINEAVKQKFNGDPNINWIIDPTKSSAELRAQYGTDEWARAEGVEQARRWAEENKGDIASIADEKACYEAVANKVAEYFAPDMQGLPVNMAYQINAKKADVYGYTFVGKALCDAVGIQAQISSGIAINGYNQSYKVLKVTLNGNTYYSDLCDYDLNHRSMYAESLPYEYTEDNAVDNLVDAMVGNSISMSDDRIKSFNAPEGTSVLRKGGVDYYISEADAKTFNETTDDSVIYSIFDKYGIPYTK
ncbi:hypothetical protein [Brotaphodocola sp.]|uniref:hypothetical protein n=1 Tax=Brotaphodocola sp. TaxID=3073577 RepID=UPI003D7EBC7B